MSTFRLKVYIAVGFFVTTVVVVLFIQLMKKIKKKLAGEEKQAPDFVLESIQNSLSQKQMMKQELNRTEKISSSILRNVDIGIGIFDTMKVMKSANPAFLSIFGLSGQIVNNSIVTFRETAVELFEYLKHIKADYRFSGKKKHLTINEREIDLRAVKIDDAEDGFRGFIVTASDVTEMEHAKRQLELKKRMEVIGEMSAGMAHEFKNSLATLKGYSQMIEDAAESDKIKKYAENILSEVHDINGVVERFLMYAKPLSPVLEILSGQELSDTVKSAMPEFRKNIRFDVDDVSFESDGVLLKQFLTNVLKNAFESCDTENTSVILKIKNAQGNKVLIEVQDNGKGMGEDTIVKAFIPFYTTKQKGTGLGLALCEKIAASLDGKLTIDSQKGEGTTVSLLL